jgi:hypothetical protein
MRETMQRGVPYKVDTARKPPVHLFSCVLFEENFYKADVVREFSCHINDVIGLGSSKAG